MRKKFLIICKRTYHGARHMLPTDRVKHCAERVQIVRIIVQYSDFHRDETSLKYSMKINTDMQE